MKNNPLLKFLVVPFAILAIVLMFKMFGSSPPQQQQGEGTPKLTEGQAKKLGVDGDTASDTLRTMVAESKQLKKQITTALEGNDELKQQNLELQRRLQNIDQTVDSRLQNVQNTFKQEAQLQNQSLVDSLKHQYESLANKQNAGTSAGADLPIGFGVQPGDGQGFEGAPGLDMVWIEPQDATPVDANGKPIQNGSNQVANGFNFPTSFGATLDRGQNALSTSVQNVAGEVSSQEARKQVRKVYTLPQNSTLMGSVAMSALIGRIPIDGTVNDPYPFKVLIGPENLTANGIDLPDVAGAVASGTASGDWTLSCVRGQIRSLTFVFNDGTVRTLPAPADEANGNQNSSQNSGNQQTIQGGLGWISDAYGIPCISGERKSNASQYIGSQVLITAAGAGAASLIKSDGNSSSFVTTPSGTVSSTGISGNEAMGKIIGQGVNDVSSWVNKLYGQAFAAVYVQPGAKVAVHLDQQLAIDYELKGRKVDYTSGTGHASTTLD
ncbi:TIGR03752 family integrating conjugative element protein [Pseudomonas chlororaphis]|uniref:TIGR03752 family integrating conjugative element protein n=1 Tax=Pseudomonas chlororaphis TaxID=587753 RepID=UPI0019271BA4|nr:TIGR03752 family integrating conjugative element protein [Pseudomonas chlororaphis]QQX57592.1 TIGR03752 family integrating conjugative element protein [Pseudomonas chlororaphis subsp. aurantiaca]